MLKIEFMESGFDDTLEDIKKTLESILGKDKTKRQKDEGIFRVLGAIDTLYNLIYIEEVTSESGT